MKDDARRLLLDLTHRGIEVAPVGVHELRYRPKKAVTSELRTRLLRNKAAVLAWLHQLSIPPMPAGLWAQCASSLLSGVADNDLRAELRNAFEERAAICEYEGGLGREDAERMAFATLRQTFAHRVFPAGNCRTDTSHEDS